MSTRSRLRHATNVGLVAALMGLAPACSCRELPSLTGGAGGSGPASGTNVGGGGTAAGAGGTGAGGAGAGGAAGGSGGTGGCNADVLTEEDNCGACGNVCALGRPCVGGACRLEPASSGALAITLDSAESPQHVVWGHAVDTALQRATIDGFVNSDIPGMWPAFELIGAEGRIGVIKSNNPLAFDPATGFDAVWFATTGVPTPAPLCPGPTCAGISDFGANRDLLAWSGPAGTGAFLNDVPTLVLPGEPASSIAYYFAGGIFIGVFAGDGTAQAAHPIRLLFQVGQPMAQSLDWPGAATRYRPQNMFLALPVLFWLTPEGDVDCADLTSLADSELPEIVQYATLPSPGSALEFAGDSVYVAMEGGMIASGPLACTAPQQTLEVLIEPTPEPVHTLGLAVRHDPGVPENNILFFTRLSLDGSPTVNQAYGGVYFRPVVSWLPLRTLEL